MAYTPSKRPSIFWPAPRVTIAFFQSGLCPSTRVWPPRAAALLAAHVDGVDVDDGDLLVGKRLFERAPDLDLRRRRMAPEHVAS